MGRVILVTGTDTEVGKTFVTAALARRLSRSGLVVKAIKPVESGCVGPVAAPSEDGAILASATGQERPTEALQRLEAPLAPPVAARQEGIPIRDDAWAMFVADLADQSDIVFVEAAGGLFSPLSDRFDALSLAKHIGADVLVVSGDRLGTINHTRLTLAVLEHAGFGRQLTDSPCIVGFVFSGPAAPDASTGSNAKVFREVSGFSRVAELDRHESFDAAAEALDDVVDWFSR